MRKILTYFTIFSAVSSSAFPVTACTFNFYVDKAAQAAIKSFANQTSNIVKSLVLGKEKSVDTAQTINDIFGDFPNSSINNLSNGKSFNNLGDFNSTWGENGNINYDGIDPNDDYFTATGKGKLTSMVNGYRSTVNTLSAIKQVTALSIADNRLLYNQLQTNNDVKKAIFNFFDDGKKTDPTQMNATTLLLKNLVLGKDWVNNNFDDQTFKKNLIDPLSFLLDYLVDNKWSATQTGTTPATPADLKTFMGNFADPDGFSYSQWGDGQGTWDLVTPGLFTPPAYYKQWNTTDFNFYRSGCLINWLFYKIGKDYNISNPDTMVYENRYLGNIITNHLTDNGSITTGIDQPKLLADLAQYWPHILQNPLYLITIAQAVMPIIKYFGLNGDVFTGTKNLTFGDIYPTDKPNESYNFADLINNIKNLFNNPDELKKVITTLIGAAPSSTPGQAFTYDIQLQIKALGLFSGPYPLGYLTQGSSAIGIKFDPAPLIDAAMGFLTKPDIVGTINTIADIYNQWIKEYNTKGQGINISLSALRDFLVGNNGLLQVINLQLVIPVLFPIFKNDPATPFDQAQYDQFYQGLGGQLPVSGQPIPLDFTPGSTLDLLKSNIGNPNTSLGKISTILFGNSTQNIPGVFDKITESDNDWIKNNYDVLFDPTNQKAGKTYKQSMTTETKDNIIISNLKYNFSFNINNKTYVFLIKCISHDDATTYKGTKTFRFTDIDLLSVTSN